MTEQASNTDPYILSQIAARQRPAVIKTKLLNFRSKYPDGPLFAVEGDDDKIVYSYWISKAAPGLAYEFFVCGGKRGVRQLKNAIHNDRGEAGKDVAFIVDRDFDDLSGFENENDVFMLERYSIENYLVSRNVVDESIKIAFPGTGDPAARHAICCLFDDDYRDFLTHAAGINKRVFIARRLCIDIDDKMPDSLTKLAKVKIGNVECSGVAPEEALPFVTSLSSHDLDVLEQEFSALDPARRYRGKFAMKFLRAWLNSLAEEFRNPERGLFPLDEQGKGTVKFDEMSLGSLASRTPPPEGFSDFVSQSTSVH